MLKNLIKFVLFVEIVQLARLRVDARRIDNFPAAFKYMRKTISGLEINVSSFKRGLRPVISLYQSVMFSDLLYKFIFFLNFPSFQPIFLQ